MTIEEQIAQLEAMRETLLPMLKRAEAEEEKASAIFWPIEDAWQDMKAQVEAVDNGISRLRALAEKIKERRR